MGKSGIRPTPLLSGAEFPPSPSFRTAYEDPACGGTIFPLARSTHLVSRLYARGFHQAKKQRYSCGNYICLDKLRDSRFYILGKGVEIWVKGVPETVVAGSNSKAYNLFMAFALERQEAT